MTLFFYGSGIFLNKKTGCIYKQPVRTALRIQKNFKSQCFLLVLGLKATTQAA
jgi:hypothetical protein